VVLKNIKKIFCIKKLRVTWLKMGEGKLTYLVSVRELVETNCQISFIRWECTKLSEGDT
jgi:hypothetical protein